MRRSGWRELSLVALLLPAPFLRAAAGTCAATPGGAVLQALGDNTTVEPQPAGYRVRDIVVDPLLHRAFVHVEQCGHPERPLILMPFAGAQELKTNDGKSTTLLTSANHTSTPAVPSGSKVMVDMGDAHMRLTIAGRLLQSAALGSVVEVQLASVGDAFEPGEQAKRVRGTLMAADRVEVLP